MQIGQTRSGEHYISFGINGGLGYDLGLSAGPFFSYYSHGEQIKPNYSPQTIEGKNWSISAGILLVGSYSSSWLNPQQSNKINYEQWETYSVQMLGLEAGANCSVGESFVPIIW